MQQIRGHHVQKVAEAILNEYGTREAAIAAMRTAGFNVARGTFACALKGQSKSPNIAAGLLDYAQRHLGQDRLRTARLVPPPLYNIYESFEDNVKHGLHFESSDLPNREQLPAKSCILWGRTLSCPFGASASCLTATSRSTLVLANAGACVLTTKTVRSLEYPVNSWPKNIAYITSPPDILEPLDFEHLPSRVYPASGWEMLGVDDSFALINSFGMPSSAPEVWIQHVARTLERLPSGTFLIVSVVGTVPDDVEKGPSKHEMHVEDFGRVVKFVADLPLHDRLGAVELNLSCPNTYGGEGEVYKDPRLAADICSRAREVLKESRSPLRLVAKVGYMPNDELVAFCEATGPYLDGYSAINTIPVEVYRKSQGGREEPYFNENFKKAGLSGIPIQKCALETVGNLRKACDRFDFNDHVIIGMGGVQKPADVKTFLDEGATVVQATTAFMHDIAFAAKVRHFLAGSECAVDLSSDRSSPLLRVAEQLALERVKPGLPRYAKEIIEGKVPYIRAAQPGRTLKDDLRDLMFPDEAVRRPAISDQLDLTSDPSKRKAKKQRHGR